MKITKFSLDPNGFLFSREGILYRQINTMYKEHYEYLMSCGLYERLIELGLLIPHKEVNIEPANPANAYKIIAPQVVSFISYSYEWCFSQLKSAALAMLKIQKVALEFGMSLKDSSSYNIQFRQGKPVLIDTLSFEKYHEGQPWAAYRQFCQHFIAPLAVMAYTDSRLNQLRRVYLDGIPLDLASTLLPLRTYLVPSLFAHIHFHARMQKHLGNKTLQKKRFKISRFSLFGLIDNLEAVIKGLKWRRKAGASYYKDVNYSAEGFQHKQRIVTEFLAKLNPKLVFDCGANTGVFSRIASKQGIYVVAFDNDCCAVEQNYQEAARNNETNILPLYVDLTNPSPSLGWWASQQRVSLVDRGPADTALALALIHHLAIANNIPLDAIADFFGDMCNSLIIEFVPKNDSQVQKMLSNREDIFQEYTKESFENAFKKTFSILSFVKIRDSERMIYLMEKNK